MSVQGMNELIVTKEWAEKDKYILCVKTEKGYSGVLLNHGILSKKRVIVHKALEQSLSGKGYIILSMNKLYERDKFYLLCEAYEIVPAYMDTAMFYAGGKYVREDTRLNNASIFKCVNICNTFLLDPHIGRSTHVRYLCWYDSNEKVHYFTDGSLVNNLIANVFEQC